MIEPKCDHCGKPIMGNESTLTGRGELCHQCYARDKTIQIVTLQDENERLRKLLDESRDMLLSWHAWQHDRDQGQLEPLLRISRLVVNRIEALEE